MFIVHETKSQTGKWEVAWTWLPYFLASDSSLHKYVGQKMTETFHGEMVEEDPAQRNALMLKMHNKALELILERYSIPGLRSYLESVIKLQPEEEVTKP
jgi:hypothetical protein